VLDNVTNPRFNSEVAKALQEFMGHKKPYVRAAALFGVFDLLKVILAGADRSSGRHLKV
jgi:hypothetical protein